MGMIINIMQNSYFVMASISNLFDIFICKFIVLKWITNVSDAPNIGKKSMDIF